MKSFRHIDANGLKDALIFLDIDGTLVDDNMTEINSEAVQKIAALKENNQVWLCSNSRNHERNRRVAELAQTPYLETNLRKPNKRILELVETRLTRKIVIGDKFMTDGLFARNIGAEFIKVARINSGRDRFYIKLLYWIDDLIAKIIDLK